MTQDEIIAMARQAHISLVLPASQRALEAFAKLVAAKEREACAKIVQTHLDANDDLRTKGSLASVLDYIMQCHNCGWNYSQHTWVGLTDEDWKEIEEMPDTFDQGVAWAQARLKEKNT